MPLGGESQWWLAIFKTASTAVAAKAKAYHHPLQVSDIAVQVYPALQLMQEKVLATNKVLRMKISRITNWLRNLKICIP